MKNVVHLDSDASLKQLLAVSYNNKSKFVFSMALWSRIWDIFTKLLGKWLC